MHCPRCNHSEDKVIDSRSSKEGKSIRRRRQCQQCEHRFSTLEEILPTEIFVIKRDGSREDFQKQKIRDGIVKACYKLEVREEQVDELMARIHIKLEQLGKTEIQSLELGELVMSELEAFDYVAYVRFASIYRQFRDIDQFLKEINQLSTRKK